MNGYFVRCVACDQISDEFTEEDMNGSEPPLWAQKQMVDHVWDEHPSLAQFATGRSER